jgi:hypothetical protein
MIVLLLGGWACVDLITKVHDEFLELDVLGWRQFLVEFVDSLIFVAYLLLEASNLKFKLVKWPQMVPYQVFFNFNGSILYKTAKIFPCSLFKALPKDTKLYFFMVFFFDHPEAIN